MLSSFKHIFITYIFLGLFVFANMGFTVYKHSCCGKTSYSVWQKSDCCHKTGTQLNKRCCSVKINTSAKKNKNCCTNEVFIKQLVNDFNINNGQLKSYFNVIALHTPYAVKYQFDIYNIKYIIQSPYLTPLNHQLNRQSLYCIYII
jgi:hypothetical protein